MHRIYCCVLTLLVVSGFAGHLKAQDIKPLSTAIEKPPANGNGSPTPLDIMQIRSNLPGSPAEKFEYLRRNRKITLDALEEVSSKKTNFSSLLSVQQATKKTIEDEAKRRAAFAPNARMQDELTQTQRLVENDRKKLEGAKARKPSASQQEIERLESTASESI